MKVSRRSVLGGVFAGAAIGVGGATTAASAETTSGGDSNSFTIECSMLRISSAGRLAPGVGESAIISGDLIDDSGAEGSLHGEYRRIASSSHVGSDSPTSIETHHFVLANGTIAGSGVASLDDAPDNFTIIGGTGAFHNAAGSYIATQRHIGLGGDGTATYQFTLTNNRSTHSTNKEEA